MKIRDLAAIFDGTVSIFIESADIKHLWICLYEDDIDNLEGDQINNVLLDSEIISIRVDTEEIFTKPRNNDHLYVNVTRESVMRLIS